MSQESNTHSNGSNVESDDKPRSQQSEAKQELYDFQPLIEELAGDDDTNLADALAATRRAKEKFHGNVDYAAAMLTPLK